VARKHEVVKVPDAGWSKRDAGKLFLITEWPAAKAEHWAIRALIAYNRGGGQIPMDMIGGGMQAIFLLGINTFLRGQMQADEVIPILDELLECVKIIRDPKARGADGNLIATDIVSDDDIMEVPTRLWLRSEVIRLHTHFSPFELLSSLISAVMKPLETTPKPPTSPASLQ
jgi:hypothetical protein